MEHKDTIKSYNKMAEDFQARNSRDFYTEEMEIFTNLFKENKKIIEIGCGTGRDAKALINKGFDYVGVDGSEGMLVISKKMVPEAKFLEMNFFNLKFPENGFDGFWAAASLLHVPKNEIDEILKSIKNIIKPDGKGFISVKEKVNLDEGEIRENKVGGINRFFAFYTKEEFGNILERSGWEIIEFIRKEEDDEKKTIWLCYFVKNN